MDTSNQPIKISTTIPITYILVLKRITIIIFKEFDNVIAVSIASLLQNYDHCNS